MSAVLDDRSAADATAPGAGRSWSSAVGSPALATAALLASRGYDVDLLEKNDDLGGRVGSIERDGFRFDTGRVVVPDARGLRALLLPARHLRRG